MFIAPIFGSRGLVSAAIKRVKISLNQANYTVEGTTYEMHKEFQCSQFLQVTYQKSFTNCVDACEMWQEPTLCEGVQFDPAVMLKK